MDIDDITLEGVYERVGISYQSEKNYTQYRWKKQDDQSLAKAAEEKSIQERVKIESHL